MIQDQKPPPQPRWLFSSAQGEAGIRARFDAAPSASVAGNPFAGENVDRRDGPSYNEFAALFSLATVAMTQTYFKRYRMEISLRRLPATSPVPPGYQLLPWSDALLDLHADVKFRSFRDELDSQVFPCLGEANGCRRLMNEISQKSGFLSAATWLAARLGPSGNYDYCGTVQGIRDEQGVGGVQNLGVTPEHRGRGLGACLLYHALLGFQMSAVRSVFLEVTASNAKAVRLYRNLGFRHVKTVYKSSEVAIN